MSVTTKLVRDRIPDLIRKSGGTPTTSIVRDEQYIDALFEKAREEIHELHADRTAEEIADVLEVLMALSDALGHVWEDVEQTRLGKLRLRGGFANGIILETTTF